MKKIIFLHIPKTAGQSIHQSLIESYGDKNICPARVNEQLVAMSIRELKSYSVFSGHLDWTKLDCVGGEIYRFTVLREPTQRVLSFYFYLREKALNSTAEELLKPENTGLRAALYSTPDEYFTGGPPHLRNFLDDHYNNFYMHYFCGRNYHAHSENLAMINRGLITYEDIFDAAISNLELLDDVYLMSDINRVFEKIHLLSGKSENNKTKTYRLNTNDSSIPGDRLGKLKRMPSSSLAVEKIEEWTYWDKKLYNLIKQK